MVFLSTTKKETKEKKQRFLTGQDALEVILYLFLNLFSFHMQCAFVI